MATFAGKSGNFPLRKRTGTAAFHLSKDAVDFGIEDLELSPLEAVRFFAETMWGSFTQMPCPHCGTIDEHYWRLRELRWKCKCCDKTFSVTSGTVFHDRKMSLSKILKIAFSWANGASGKAALQLRRDWNVAYQTVFTMLHKLREGLERGYNTGVLCGVQEMDGMDVLGKRYREKRNVPQGGHRPGKPSIPSHLMKPEGGADFVGPPKPFKHEKVMRQPSDRRILLVIRQRGVSNGKGAVATRVGVTMAENAKAVSSLAAQYASVESTFMTDEDPSYASFKARFADHKTVTHSKTFSAPDGANNNQAESFNWRMRRAAEGIYLNISTKYLKDYAAEQAWREDTRGMSTSRKLKHLLQMALSIGLSIWWRGYTHGRHRNVELLIDGERAVESRGKRVGAKPKKPR